MQDQKPFYTEASSMQNGTAEKNISALHLRSMNTEASSGDLHLSAGFLTHNKSKQLNSPSTFVKMESMHSLMSKDPTTYKFEMSHERKKKRTLKPSNIKMNKEINEYEDTYNTYAYTTQHARKSDYNSFKEQLDFKISNNDAMKQGQGANKVHVLSGPSIKMIRSLQEKHFGKIGKERQLEEIKTDYEAIYNKDIANNDQKRELNSIKQKAFKGLNKIFKEEIKHAQQEDIKKQVTEANEAASMVVERLQADKLTLTKEFERAQIKMEELELQLFELNSANQVLTRKYSHLQSLYEEKSKLNYELELFNESKKLLNQKFPGYTLERIMDRCEVLEEKLQELLKKLGETENEFITYEREIKKEKNISALKAKEIEDLEKQKKKAEEMLYEKANIEVEEKILMKGYKDSYLTLSNKIINLFTKWNKLIGVYDPIEKQSPALKDFPKPDYFDDPLEILNIMDKMVFISIPARLTQYLRRIIVSANMLQKKFLPSEKKDTFDPEKIYEKLTKYIDHLQRNSVQKSKV